MPTKHGVDHADDDRVPANAAPEETPVPPAEERPGKVDRQTVIAAAIAQLRERGIQSLDATDERTLVEASRIDCARALGLSDKADWQELYLRFTKRDREEWIRELKIQNPAATWEEIKQTRTREQWEEYAYESGFFLNEVYAFDLMRLERWVEFVLRKGHAHRAPLTQILALTQHDVLLEESRKKYGLRPRDFGKAVNERIRADAGNYGLDPARHPQQLVREIREERVRRRHAKAHGKPALTMAAAKKKKKHDEYVESVGLRKNATWEEIELWNAVLLREEWASDRSHDVPNER